MNAGRRQAELFLRIARRARRAFERMLESSDPDDFPVAAFLAQQAAEKSLKAVLCLRGIAYDHTHDLAALAEQLAAASLEMPVALEDLLRLTPYAVAFRYDDTLLPLLTPERARRIVGACVDWCDACLGKAADA